MARRLRPRRLRPGEEATLVEHLGELRTRLLIALLATAVAFPVTFYFRELLLEWLTEPLPKDRRLVSLGVTEAFFTTVKVTLYAAFSLALPVVLYQVWAFLAPAAEKKTQRVMAIFALIATALFAAGVAFAYFIVLPKALSFLIGFETEFFRPEIRASYYFSFVSLALVAMGIVFEMPIFILALVRLQVVTSAQLVRNWRMGVFLVAVVAVLLPTVDPVSLLFEIVPLLILYALSLGLAVLMERRWQRAGVLWAAPE